MAIKEKEAVDLNAKVEITMGDILQLFAKIQQDNSKATETQAKVLAEAFAESRKPYVSPGQEENVKNQREAQRKIEIFKIKNLKRQQALCEHEIGQTGRKRLGEGAFNMLKLATGETIGVCSYCQMVISSANPDHQKYFRKAGGTVAEAGQFTCADPIKAQLARLSPDERAKVLAAREKFFAETPKDEVEEDIYNLA